MRTRPASGQPHLGNARAGAWPSASLAAEEKLAANASLAPVEDDLGLDGRQLAGSSLEDDALRAPRLTASVCVEVP
jgi:hypothetical protein